MQHGTARNLNYFNQLQSGSLAGDAVLSIVKDKPPGDARVRPQRGVKIRKRERERGTEAEREAERQREREGGANGTMQPN